MKKLTTLLCVAIVGCGGGGGGGGSSSSGGGAPTPFTSWSQIVPNSTVQASGGYTFVNSYQASQSSTGALITAAFDNNKNVSMITMSTPQGSASFNVANGDSIYSALYNNVLVASNKANTAAAVFVNPAANGWNYQTFGVWGNTGTFANSPASAAASVGSATPISGLPATGTALFTGNAAGIFVNTVGAAYATDAAMSANVNFANRTVGFATTGTIAVPVYGSGATVSAPLLNMSGNLSYAAGSSNFSGAVSTTGGMTGAAAGTFYGPNANEIGGTYGVGNAQIGAMIGGFGGKR